MIRNISYSDFDLYHTLLSGQTFEWFQNIHNPTEWEGTLNGISIKLEQIGDRKSGVLKYESESNLDSNLIQYFGFEDNYINNIQNISFDKNILKTLDKLYGLRVIKQDPWYSLNAFILSQNNTVKNIQNSLRNLSNFVNNSSEITYRFPEHDKVKNLSLEQLISFKTGYRSVYLLDLYKRIDIEPNFINSISKLSYEEGKNKLMSIKGIGEKVADCILLYGYSKYEAYPLDVHLRRATQEIYFSDHIKKPNDKQLRDWAKRYWGNMAGFAHFFLFTYRRLYGEIT